MNILLIFPRIEHGASTYRDKGSWTSILFGYPIITLPHIAALTPEKHTVKIINENYEDIDYTQDIDLVGITTYTMTAPRAYKIADEFRQRGKKVILGGYHPTALPKESKRHADSVVLGEAEAIWLQVLIDAEKETLRPFYGPNEKFEMDQIPPLRRDLIMHNPILGAVQTTRGCTNRCEFCAISYFCRHGVKHRPIKNVVEEIKQMPNKMFIIHDPHLTINPKYAQQLFQELIRQKVRKSWVANGTTNVLLKADEKFLVQARKSGCVEWFVGFESVSQAALDSIKKTHNKVEDFEKMVKRVHKHGMAIQGGIIFGFDEDTPDIFDSTIEKIYELGIDILEINILTPYPGTPLYHRLEKEGRILTKDWSRYNQVDVVFRPKNMTVEELRQGTRKVAKEFYSWKNIIRRDMKIFSLVKKISAILPAGTNYTFRKYYKADFYI
jgi:radical SAM superfamily enzyme YgiQ (UPF0313 family)